MRPCLDARGPAHADETSADLWMINGLVPPPGGSEAERTWARRNAASPY